MLQAPGPLGVTAGRLAETYEIASLIPLLLSGAAAGITGADYLIDGGAAQGRLNPPPGRAGIIDRIVR